VAELPPLQQRKVAAIVGACCADAAAQPMHWVYKDEDMAKLIEGQTEIEFRDPSANPFYRIPTGSNTCYGDQAFVMLKSLVDNKGLDTEKLITENYEYFGPQSKYESEATNQYQVGKEDKINLKKTYPIDGPWRHGCIKDFLANMKSGTKPPGSDSDDQIDCAIRMIPLVALFAGHPDLLSKAEAAIRVLQESDMSVACGLAAVRVLEQYILNGNPENVFEKTMDELRDPQRKNPQDLDLGVSSQIRDVVKAKDMDHFEAVPKLFRKN